MSHRRALALAALLLAACTPGEERATRHFEQGEAYLAGGDTKAARLEFQSALKLRPGDATLYERIGDALYESGEGRAGALPYYEEAHRLDPSRLHASVRLADLIASQRPRQARALLEQALEQAPDDPRVHRLRSRLALLAGDYGEGLSAAWRAVRLDRDDPHSWAHLGAVHVARATARPAPPIPANENPFESALNAFDEVEELSGGADPLARLEKARVYGFASRHAEADKTFREAIKLAEEQGSPGDVRFAAVVTDEYARRRGKMALRRFALRSLVRSDPNAYEAWVQLAQVVDSFPGRSAEEIFVEMLQAHPTQARAHLRFASYLSENGRGDDAEAHLRRVMGQGVRDPRLGEGLVRLLLRRGRSAEARAAYVALQSEFPDAFPTRVATARIDLAEGRIDEAVTQLELLTSEQGNHELLRLLALTYQRSGDLEAASETIERALRVAPADASPALRLRAHVAVEMGDWKRATQSYERLLRSGAELSEGERAQYARALHGTGQGLEARATLDELLERDAAVPRAALAYAEIEQEGQPMRARLVLEQALAQTPQHSELLKALTRLELEQGLGEMALERLNQRVADGQASAETLLLRAEVLTALGTYEYAEGDALRAFEADPSRAEAIDLLHNLYRAQGKLAEARRSFEQAQEAGVLHPGAQLLLARLYLEEGDTTSARETLEHVVSEDPALWNAKSTLARVLAEREDDVPRALELAREANSAAPREPSTADALGYVQLKAGQPERALEEFDRAAQLARRRSDPVPPTVLYHRGLALRALGRNARAAEAFEQALARGNFAEADDARAQLEAARPARGAPSSS